MITRIITIVCFTLIPFLASAQNIFYPPVKMGITLNGSVDAALYRGWPLLVNTQFLNENLFQENVPVKLISGWEDKFRFIIKSAEGDTVSWPFHLINHPPDNVILDSTTIANLVYWLDDEETNGILSGDYKLIAVLDSTAYPDLGSNFSSAVTDTYNIKISDEPSSLSIEEQTEKDLLFANLNIMRGDEDKAFEYLNNILVYNSDDLRTLLLTGKLFENQGDYGSAMFLYSKAVDIFFDANPDSPEPPFELLQAQNDLAYKLDNAYTFNITLAEKDTSHPFYGLGSASCFYVDNISIRELQLKRGFTYNFYLNNIPAENPFYFSSDIKGGGTAPYTEGVTGTPGDSNDIITFTVSLNAPDLLYYQSYTNEYTGWRINIADSTSATSVNENKNVPSGFYISLAYPNPFNPLTNINVSLNKQQHISIKVFNIVGEELKTLFDGILSAGETHTFKFDGAALVSGIYLIRIEGDDFRETRKVVLLK